MRVRLVETMRQRECEKLPFSKLQEIIQFQMAFALERALAAFAAGEQLAEPAVSRAIARIDQNIRRAIDENDPRSHQRPWLVRDVGILEFLEGPHDTSKRVVVGNADDGDTKFSGLMDIGLRMRAAAQERKVRGDADFRVTHANNPCMNQFGATALPS